MGLGQLVALVTFESNFVLMCQRMCPRAGVSVRVWLCSVSTCVHAPTRMPT